MAAVLDARPLAPPLAAPAFRAAAVVGWLLAAALGLLLVRYALTPLPRQAYAWDFRAFDAAARDWLHGRSPYPQPELASMATQQAFVYPVAAAAAFAPLALLPFPVAAVLFVAASAACLALALRLVGVRDPRCYAVALLAVPAQDALRLGTLMPALTLLLAVAWRWRDRRAVAVPALAALVVAKLFLWPLAVWFLVTRRARTAVAAAALGGAAVVLAALPIGLHGLTGYPALLRVVSDYETPFGWAPAALSPILALVLGGALLAAVVAARRDDLLSFRLAVAASFALTPIVWGHYFVLLLVPFALRRPRFSPAWLLLAWPVASLLGDFGPRAPWVVAALACAAAQLGLLPALRLPPAATGLAAGAAAAALLGVTAVGHLRDDASAALTGAGSGVAYLRFEHGRVCWQAATAGLTDPQARLVARGRSIPLGRFGARGCAPAPSGGYVLVASAREGSIRGVLVDPVSRTPLP